MLPFSIGSPDELKRFWACELDVGPSARNGLGCLWVRTTVAVADSGWARVCVYVCIWSGRDELIDKEERARQR